MMKKKVPEWLNSSLWSATPSADSDDRLVRNAFKPSNAAIVAPSEPAPPPTEPPIPVPPPSASKQQKKEEHEREPRDSRSFGDQQNGNSSGNTNTSTNSPEDVSRRAQLLTELSKKVVNVLDLRKIASQGIPDGAGIRSTVWKLLLGYLPADRSLWSAELAKKRSQYKHFKEELLMNPTEITRRLEKSSNFENDDSKCEDRGLLSRNQIPHGEHPLSLGKTSVWNQFFQVTLLVLKIGVLNLILHMHSSVVIKVAFRVLWWVLGLLYAIIWHPYNPGIDAGPFVKALNSLSGVLFVVKLWQKLVREIW